MGKGAQDIACAPLKPCGPLDPLSDMPMQHTLPPIVDIHTRTHIHRLVLLVK